MRKIGRATTALAMGIGLVAAVAVIARPAGAATYDGRLLSKGVGSQYSDAGYWMVQQAVGPGKSATFSLKILNTGTARTQYRVELREPEAPITATLLTGSTVQPSVFWTASVAAGASSVLSVRLTAPAFVVQETYVEEVAVYTAIDGMMVGSAFFGLNIAASAHGVDSYALFAHQGSQPAVGGSVDGQIAQAPAVPLGGSGSFVVRLQNDGPAPTRIGLVAIEIFGCTNWKFTVKAGGSDVTAAALAGTYFTPTLAAGAHKDLTVAIKYSARLAGCGGDYFHLATHDGNIAHHDLYLLMIAAA